jgi:hypothetical protein
MPAASLYYCPTLRLSLNFEVGHEGLVLELVQPLKCLCRLQMHSMIRDTLGTRIERLAMHVGAHCNSDQACHVVSWETPGVHGLLGSTAKFSLSQCPLPDLVGPASLVEQLLRGSLHIL